MTASVAIGAVDLRQALQKILADQYSGQDAATVQQTLSARNYASWTNEELLNNFEIEIFQPPYVTVIRKADGCRGTVLYIDNPRIYFCFEPITTNDATTRKKTI